MHLKMSSVKWRTFCLGLKVLNLNILPAVSCKIYTSFRGTIIQLYFTMIYMILLKMITWARYSSVKSIYCVFLWEWDVIYTARNSSSRIFPNHVIIDPLRRMEVTFEWRASASQQIHPNCASDLYVAQYRLYTATSVVLQSLLCFAQKRRPHYPD